MRASTYELHTRNRHVVGRRSMHCLLFGPKETTMPQLF